MTVPRSPRNKLDTDSVASLWAADPAAVEPLLPELLTWLQDFNWPVAAPLRDYLLSLGPRLVPHLKKVLWGHDDVWKYWLLQEVVAKLPDEVLQTLADCVRSQEGSAECALLALQIQRDRGLATPADLAVRVQQRIRAVEYELADLRQMYAELTGTVC